MLEENRRVPVNALTRLAGWGRVVMASAEELRATLGVEPGSVTPFGLPHVAPGSVRLALDRAVAEAAGLTRFLEASGHPPHILDLDAV